jgi:hypothetical protein
MNVPKPVTTTLSPFFMASVIAPKTAATDSRAAFAVKLAFFATTSTRSDFVIDDISPPPGQKDEKIFVKIARTTSNRKDKEFGLLCQDIKKFVALQCYKF